MSKELIELARQTKTDLASAHVEICKLQGLDPATHSWPTWSSPAHTIAWCDRILNAADALSLSGTGEAGWLIEQKGGERLWIHLEDGWTDDASKALRFARKEDAETYINYIGWTETFASAFSTASTASPATQPGDVLHGVKVKPLKWQHFDVLGNEPEQWFANDTSFGGASFTATFDKDCELPWVARPFPPGPSNYATADEAKAALETAREARILSALDLTSQDAMAKALEHAAVAGWNACRKSVYAVCEDIRERAANPAKVSLAVTDEQRAHEKGYYFGEDQAAKSIARGFNSMEAMDDDNLRAVLAAFRHPKEPNP